MKNRRISWVWFVLLVCAVTLCVGSALAESDTSAMSTQQQEKEDSEPDKKDDSKAEEKEHPEHPEAKEKEHAEHPEHPEAGETEAKEDSKEDKEALAQTDFQLYEALNLLKGLIILNNISSS